jgi:hypothetical protein
MGRFGGFALLLGSAVITLPAPLNFLGLRGKILFSHANINESRRKCKWTNFVEIVKVILSETDWATLIRRVTAYVLKLAREMPAIFDGVSVEDLVEEALLAYLKSDNGLNWDPSKGSRSSENVDFWTLPVRGCRRYREV